MQRHLQRKNHLYRVTSELHCCCHAVLMLHLCVPDTVLLLLPELICQR